jgi:hypothetical protein
MNRRLRAAIITGAGAFTLVAPLNFVASAVAAAQRPASNVSGASAPQPSKQYPVRTGTVKPGSRTAAGPQLSAKEHAALVERHLKNRERIAAAEVADHGPVGPSSTPDALPTNLSTTEAGAVDINNRNTVSQSFSGTLAEPSTANEEAFDGNPSGIVYAGNQNGRGGYRSRGTNRGGSFTHENAPGGPTDAPNLCCDWDVVHDNTRNVMFTSTLYVNAGDTNGLVRIFVRSNVEAGDNCFYDFNPTGATNILPDYPHIAMSNNFLYLTTNTITNGAWAGAQAYRLNPTQMAACQSVNFSVFTYTGTQGQRVFTPAEGATTEMFFATPEVDGATSDTFRLFRWREADAGPTSIVSTVQNSNFTDPDCRGGTGNFDFVRAQDTSTLGFGTRGAVGGGRVTFFWPVGPDASHTQGHVNGASWRTSDLVRDASPVIFNNGSCFAFPVVGSNARGELGLSIANGGQAGGGGVAAQGWVGVDDDDSSGIFFPTVFIVATGTHNRSDGRYGDYLTVRSNHRHDSCNSQWVATAYSLDGGNTSSADVNARYVEFRSDNDAVCPK